MTFTAWKVSKYGGFSGPYLAQIQENTNQKKLHIFTLFTQWSEEKTRLFQKRASGDNNDKKVVTPATKNWVVVYYLIKYTQSRLGAFWEVTLDNSSFYDLVRGFLRTF